MKYLITTSRNPSKRTRSFAKDLAFLFLSKRTVRGKQSLNDLIKKTLNENLKLIIIDTAKGNPSRLRIFNKKNNYQILIKNVKLLREFKENFPFKKKLPVVLANSKIAENFAEILGLEKIKEKTQLKEDKFLIEIIEKKHNNKKIYLLFLKDTNKNYGLFFKIRKIIK